MEGSVHIYTAALQPATHWVDNCGPEPMIFEWPAGRLLWCRCCCTRHRAVNCVVQAYYDGLSIWCAHGKGCKDPRVIAAKRRREHRNRSAGQRRRWAKKAV